MFIGIAGIIGAGKSTLCQQLADHLGYEAYKEPVDDNPYFNDWMNKTRESTCLRSKG